jgi:HTH-type transcriptional regulator, transcriptional repressor of NAD biosynthesis genes
MKMKKYKTGLVVGKFYPLHNGHRYLIERALGESERLVLIVCHTRKYKIPAKVRAGWIKELYPQVEVKIFNHAAYLDSTSTDISQQWAELTIKFLGFVPEVVFSSEQYGKVFAKYMGSQHVEIDLKRKNMPISATQIRNNLYKYWKYLPEVVRTFFVKRIVILGAESTGTTTLAQDLAKYYKTTWVPEYGRTYFEGRMNTVGADKWTTNEFINIANGQNNLENALIIKSNKVLICDTDAFTTSIWHQRYMGHKTDKLKSIIDQNPHDFYILTDTDIPFVQDGTRESQNLRQWMHHEFIDELTKTKRPFMVVGGNREKRKSQSIIKIDQLLIDERKKYEDKS